MFDFAVRVTYTNRDWEPLVQTNIHQYAYSEIHTVKFGWEIVEGNVVNFFDMEKQESIICPSGRFAGEEKSTQIIGIESGDYLCPKHLNFTV